MLHLDYMLKLQRQDERVTVFLINGVKLQGQITEIEADAEGTKVISFILTRSDKTQLVMHAHVATVLPEETPQGDNDGNRG